MSLRRRVLLVLTAAGLAASLIIGYALAADSAEPAAPAGRTVQPGVLVHLDAQGNLIEPPPDAEKGNAASARSAAGFTYEPTPGGGVMLNFNGAWQSAATARLTAERELDVRCVPVAPQATAVFEEGCSHAN